VDRLAAAFTRRGESALVVDTATDLDLHERFGAGPRWGLSECLAGEVPLLGAVQSAGRPRFYVLGRGAAGAGGRWEGLSAVLEEARRHFDRVVLALDPGAPRAAALPLGGRVLEAWWAEPGNELPRRAAALAERLGISFTSLDLGWLAQVEHEDAPALPATALAAAPESGAVASAPSRTVAEPEPEREAPSETLVAAPEPEPEREAPSETLVEPGTRPAPAIAPAPAAAAEPVPSGPPPVLDCDPEVRDRLRFLVWMKRVQAERRAAPVGAGAEG
jgi:hypothetical protein